MEASRSFKMLFNQVVLRSSFQDNTRRANNESKMKIEGELEKHRLLKMIQVEELARKQATNIAIRMVYTFNQGN